MAATTRAVDLTDVKEGGGSFRPKRKPAGDYKAKIVKVEDHQPKDKDKGPGWVFTIQVDGDARASYPYYVNPAPKEKWKIGQICRAAGMNVAGKRVNFNPNKLVGKAIGVALDDDEYEGRLKSVVDDLFPVSEVGPNANEGAPDDAEYEEVDTAEDEVIYEDEDEEEEPEPEPPVRKTRRKPAPEPEPEDDEEEEEEPAPKPTRRRAAPPPAKRTVKKATPPPVDDDDLDEIELDDLDD
ncbi:MAG: hypothetical protein ABW022_11215 [Actinoplanes sp.]